MRILLLIMSLLMIFGSLKAQLEPEYLLVLQKATDAEMNAATAEKGALIYNTDDDKVYQFDGTNWVLSAVDGDADASNELQVLSYDSSTHTLTLTNGGTVDLSSLAPDVDWNISGSNQYSAVSGNVGIGTTSPNEKLEVNGNSKISNGHLYIAGVNPSIKLNGDGSSHYPQIDFSMLNGDKRGRLRAYGAADALLYEFNNHIFRDFNGVELVRIKQSGDVGIGTNDPKVHLNNNSSSISADLEISTIGKTGVDGRTDLSLFSDLDGSNPANIFLQGKLSTGDYGWATWSFRGNHSLNEYKDWVDFGVNDGNATKEQMIRMNVLNGDVVFNEGNVGVGTVSPTRKLDVEGDVAHTGSLFSRGSNYTYAWMRFQDEEWGNSLVLGSGGTTILGGGEFATTAQSHFDVGAEPLVLGSDSNISFYTNTQNGWQDVNHAMEIRPSGNVGIGTANPQANLHISSEDTGDAKLIIESDTDDNDEDDHPMLIFKQDGGIEESAIVQDHNELHFKNSISAEGGIVFDVGKVNGFENAAEVMRITSDGDVGIHTTNPKGELDVNGILVEGKKTSMFGNNSGNGSCAVSRGIASFFTSDANTNYIHIKLPYKVDSDARMYHIHATGYRYRSGKVIDLTWVGYCYSPSNSLIETGTINAGSPEFTMTQYVGSNNHIYLRFKGTTGTNYYQSFRIDSMFVGNGSILKEGDVEIISSASANL